MQQNRRKQVKVEIETTCIGCRHFHQDHVRVLTGNGEWIETWRNPTCTKANPPHRIDEPERHFCSWGEKGNTA